MQIITNYKGLILLHSIILLFYITFIIIRYFIRVYKRSGKKVFLKQLLFRLFTPLALIIITFKIILYVNTHETFQYQWNHTIENKADTIQNLYAKDGKHRGVGVYDFGRSNRTTFHELNKTNVEWVAIFPYFYQEDEQSKTIRSMKEIGKWSARDSSFMKSIDSLHKRNIRVHLKPHLWMGEGWRATINFKNPEDWDTWFTSYEQTILHYALMAEKTNVELFCIGTELRTAVKNKPTAWNDLIKKIRNVYSGKLTYAANWDGEFNDVQFWDELDYIGIQGYFPLTSKSNPDLETIQQGWKSHIEILKSLSEKYQKKILFTEVGYRPDVDATRKPWEWGSAFGFLFKKKSEKTQYLAYEALYSELWNKEWFAGSYIWQWTNSDFSVKGRPAENVIAKWYSTQNN